MIRKAMATDGQAIKFLLDQLDYFLPVETIAHKIAQMVSDPDNQTFVYETAGRIEAFISIHFVPQLGLAGDFAIIGYFAVDEKSRNQSIGTELEQYATLLASKRNCDRIQVHCNLKREDAHRFYERQGYHETRKYYTKQLVHPLSA
jgi:GNAT superfamily N-acetyltransferase